MRYLLIAVLSSALCAGSTMSEAPLPWAVYYSDSAQPEDFSQYRLLVFDADAHPRLASLRPGRTLLGYISVGEVESHRAHFKRAESQGILRGENKNWPGSFFVDVRDPRWREEVIRRLIPRVLARGFNGVFLDTIDNAEYLETLDPVQNHGMMNGMADLIKGIRQAYPRISLAINRGLRILPMVERDVDIVLGESLMAAYDFDAKEYRFVPEPAFRDLVSVLQAAKQRRPQLTVLTLDYWNPQDAETIAAIYRRQRANGFHPYVGTLALDQIVREPHGR